MSHKYTRGRIPGTLKWAKHRLNVLRLIAQKGEYVAPDITPEVLVSFYTNHNHLCDICGISNEQNKRELALDHCHKTGRVRGWLCYSCNTYRIKAVENFGDKIRQYLYGNY